MESWGAGGGSCAPAMEPRLPGAPRFSTKALSDETLKALSFWKPEVCENKEREQREPFTAARLTCEHFFSLWFIPDTLFLIFIPGGKKIASHFENTNIYFLSSMYTLSFLPLSP